MYKIFQTSRPFLSSSFHFTISRSIDNWAYVCAHIYKNSIKIWKILYVYIHLTQKSVLDEGLSNTLILLPHIFEFRLPLLHSLWYHSITSFIRSFTQDTFIFFLRWWRFWWRKTFTESQRFKDNGNVSHDAKTQN